MLVLCSTDVAFSWSSRPLSITIQHANNGFLYGIFAVNDFEHCLLPHKTLLLSSNCISLRLAHIEAFLQIVKIYKKAV